MRPELIATWDVERLNEILETDTPAFAGVPVTYAPAVNGVAMTYQQAIGSGNLAVEAISTG